MKSFGEVSLEEGDILRLQDSCAVTIPIGEQHTVKVLVKQGRLQLKAVKFTYKEKK